MLCARSFTAPCYNCHTAVASSKTEDIAAVFVGLVKENLQSYVRIEDVFHKQPHRQNWKVRFNIEHMRTTTHHLTEVFVHQT